MDVRGGPAACGPGYALKLNTYDLGVDIELADASSACASSTPRCARSSSRAARTACSARARTSTCSAASTHAFKVNFCKFTNETRLALEDASRALAACAYARRAERRLRRRRLRAGARLRRDPARRRRHLRGRLPEVPLLGVLPGHRRPHAPRRQAQGAPRPRRRLLTLAEGVKGKRAVRVGPRRRGRAAQSRSRQRVAGARAGAGRGGARRAAGPGVALDAARADATATTGVDVPLRDARARPRRARRRR